MKMVRSGQIANVLKKQPTAIPDRLDIGSERKGGIKDDSDFLEG